MLNLGAPVLFCKESQALRRLSLPPSLPSLFPSFPSSLLPTQGNTVTELMWGRLLPNIPLSSPKKMTLITTIHPDYNGNRCTQNTGETADAEENTPEILPQLTTLQVVFIRVTL